MNKIEKLLVVILLIWSFFHTFLLLQNIDILKSNVAATKPYLEQTVKVSPKSLFFPFTKDTYAYINEYQRTEKRVAWGNFQIDFYDYTEYFVYVVGVWMLFWIYRLLKKK